MQCWALSITQVDKLHIFITQVDKLHIFITQVDRLPILISQPQLVRSEHLYLIYICRIFFACARVCVFL